MSAAAKFKDLWKRVSAEFSGNLKNVGFRKFNHEVYTREINSECLGAIQINPFSRVIHDDCILVDVHVGLTFPRVDELYRLLWKVGERDKSDIFMPLSIGISRLLGGDNIKGIPIPVENGRQAIADAVSGILNIYNRDVIPIGDIAGTISLLQDGGGNSPWYSKFAYECLLPVILIYAGRDDEAIALVKEIIHQRSEIRPPVDISLYSAFSRDLINYSMKNGKSSDAI